MSKLSQAVGFTTSLYLRRVGIWHLAHVRRDPMGLLETRRGREDPYAVYRLMRRNGRLTRTSGGDWATASHRVCSAVLRDRAFGVTPDPLLDLSFLAMNPPDHTRLRRLVQPTFSPKTLPAFRDRIERTVNSLLDQATATGRFDLVSAYAAPLPIAVITDLLGIPDADSREFEHHGAVVASALDGIRSPRHAARFEDSNTRLQALYASLIALRRRHPTDDLISHLLSAEGDQIKPSELEPMINLLLIAGFETTVNLIGNCVLALLNNPAQWEALRADPQEMAPKAVEEALRFDPPVQGTGRIALKSTELEGRHIRQGEWILTMIGAAGRDPEVYDHPDTFDITRRTTTDHLAFSSGVHYCVGQPLARMEATIAIQLLAERLPNLRLAGRIRRRPTSTIRGLAHLPVH